MSTTEVQAYCNGPGVVQRYSGTDVVQGYTGTVVIQIYRNSTGV